jgi:tRNA pseudouridine32 synthase/23S rRNA pseudouridine746 synthase
MYNFPSYNRPFEYLPPRDPLSLLAETDDYLLVDKPAGLLSVPGKTEPDCLESRVQFYCPTALTIHRLDMATSGLMIFAKTKHAQRHLGLQFEKRQTVKTYLAKIAGHPVADSGRINLPIWTDWPNRPRQKIDYEKGRKAITDWTVMTPDREATLVRLHPVTGRSHQLRLHMLCMGHPIIGDRLYAPEKIYKQGNRLHLHAHSLKFREPTGGAWVNYTSPCPF